MSPRAETESNRSPEIELSIRSTTNTQTFLETCALDADHEALEEHLVNNPLQQSNLDGCLLRGLQVVQREEKELSHVVQALILLLQFGAKWNSDALLDDQKTPYHIVCESPGDHHELLDLMIKSSQQTLIDKRDQIYGRTALMYAVHNANINCVKCLIANGTDVNILNDKRKYQVLRAPPQISSAIIEAILLMRSDSKFTSVIKDIFDLLLDKSSLDCFMSLTFVAATYRNVYCIKKLIEKSVHHNFFDLYQQYMVPEIAILGNVELLKLLFNHGIDKDSTDENGVSILWYVADSGNIEAVRYLLDLGVTIPTYTQDVREAQCEQCKENAFIVNDNQGMYSENKDPFMRSIYNGKLEIIKLLDERGSQTCKSFSALRHAVMRGNVKIMSYLLKKYTYPLNMEYIKCEGAYTNSGDSKQGYTLLTELNFTFLPKFNLDQIIKLLLDHGADPAKAICADRSPNALMTAIYYRDLKVIIQYIRSGVDINFRSYSRRHGHVLPFESSVLSGYQNVAEMLLISGCSCGVFSLDNNHKFKNNVKHVTKLMKEWRVQENNVIPLKQRCRSVILNHLCPRADLKIEKLPLPGCLIKFLSIPELDVIVDQCT